MKTPIITVKELTKQFSVYHKPHEVILDLLPYFSSKIQKHTALDHISFEVHRGEFLGIIGQNGSGKSTLLKILCGVLHQTSGEITINGKVLSLLELGTGFNPSLTGRENLFVSASLMGFDTKLIAERLTDIEAFADINEYFDAPVKTYSSGMYVRLAMSMFLHLEPEIFIIDEALSVGDIFFQQKCFTKIEEMRNRGVTFLFVSHDINTILNMSDRVLLLDHSKQIYLGDKHEACKLYYDQDKKILSSFHEQSIETECTNNSLQNNLLDTKKQIFHRSGASFKSLQVVDESGNHTLQVTMSKKLYFIIEYIVEETVKNPAIAITFFNNKNMLLTTIVHALKHGNNFIEIKIPFMFEAGEYTIRLSIGNQKINEGYMITEYNHNNPIMVTFDYHKEKAPFLGLVGLNTEIKYWSVENASFGSKAEISHQK